MFAAHVEDIGTLSFINDYSDYSDTLKLSQNAGTWARRVAALWRIADAGGKFPNLSLVGEICWSNMLTLCTHPYHT